jgi:TonB family protein
MTVAPAPIPAAQKIEKNKPPETKPTPALRPEDLKPAKKTTPKNAQDNSQKRAQDIKNIIRNLKQNLSQSTTVDMPGTSSVAYANYASVVRSVYDAAWTLPDTVANDEENVKISVTIANDGTVITARIVTPSGDAPVDATVQKALERVKFVAPFPEGATEKERTYVINFNPKAKRLE